jgi:hypothetical protein
VALYDRVIAVNKTLGVDHNLTIRAMRAKADVLSEMGETENLNAAIKLLNAILSDARATETAATMQHTANALVMMGGPENLEAAVALYVRVIRIKTTAFGANHTETATPMQHKANALVIMGGPANLRDAVALYDDVIEIKTAAFGARGGALPL